MSTVIENVVCTFCGSLCDDLTVEVDGGRVVRLRNVCGNGNSLFTHYDPAQVPPTVNGQEVTWDDAIAEAARILDGADSPLIYGLSSTASEAQRKAIALADKLGAMIDTTSSICHGPSGLAMQAVGEPTCTLGEVRSRADLVIFWGCNPAESHLRHFGRYSVTAKGMLTPRGKRDRTVVVVDVRPTSSARVADLFLQVAPGKDYEVLTTLRALVKGKAVASQNVGGLPVSQLQALADQMKGCRFGVVHMGMGLTQTGGRDVNVSELFTLVAELNQYSRFSVIPMRGHGNVTGADQVMAWQTGYPFGVSFSRGYPRYGPGEFTTVDVLARGEADAAVIIASDPVAHLPRAAAQHLERIPTIVLDPMPTLTGETARVVLPTACYGLDAPGTAYRMDAVPLRLQPVLPRQRPTDEDVLDRIIEAVQAC
jgi:formylmethanofuran dehydrogenase subunit B